MLSWLVQNAVMASVLAVCVAALCRIFRPRPAVCHALWLVVLLKLVAPPIPLWGTSWLQPWFQNLAERAAGNSTNTKVVAHRELPRQAHDDGVAARSAIVLRESNHNAPLETVADDAAAGAPWIVDEQASQNLVNVDPANAGARPISTQATQNTGGVETVAVEPLRTDGETPFQLMIRAMLVLWAAGSLSCCCAMRSVSRACGGLFARSSAAPKWLVGEVAVQSCKYRLRPPRVGVCSGLPCPVVVALPRATLLWPADLEQRLDDGATTSGARTRAGASQAARSSRGVARGRGSMPVVVASGRLVGKAELSQYAELACDAWVVAQLPTERSRYAKALVDVCEFISLAKTPPAPAVGMRAGIAALLKGDCT